MPNRDRASGPPSGRFVLRMAPELHGALRVAAEREGLSLNAYCIRHLARSVAPGSPRWSRSAPGVERAVEILDGSLEGVVAFGSWARGNACEGSDVDILVVVTDDVAIDRGLYRLWDQASVRSGGREVEAHFVRLPSPTDPMTGLWAEVALDGIVLWERDLRVSRWLGAVRSRLFAGGFVRRTIHGQPYWQERVTDAQS